MPTLKQKNRPDHWKIQVAPVSKASNIASKMSESKSTSDLALEDGVAKSKPCRPELTGSNLISISICRLVAGLWSLTSLIDFPFILFFSTFQSSLSCSKVNLISMANGTAKKHVNQHLYSHSLVPSSLPVRRIHASICCWLQKYNDPKRTTGQACWHKQCGHFFFQLPIPHVHTIRIASFPKLFRSSQPEISTWCSLAYGFQTHGVINMHANFLHAAKTCMQTWSMHECMYRSSFLAQQCKSMLRFLP